MTMASEEKRETVMGDTPNQVTENATGGKQSAIKRRHDMFPLAMLKVAEVCHGGNLKYDPNNPMTDTLGSISPNWHKITAREHLIHSLDHVFLMFAGDTSGDDHLAHAACRMMFALEQHLREKQGEPTHGDIQKCPNCNEWIGDFAFLEKEPTHGSFQTCPKCNKRSAIFSKNNKRYFCSVIGCGWKEDVVAGL